MNKCLFKYIWLVGLTCLVLFNSCSLCYLVSREMEREQYYLKKFTKTIGLPENKR